MKEPITGRDLFVISATCTGFGALLAWGLFYRWGSAPNVKDVDLSAWVQAIGTVIAIGIAIAVPHQVYAKERIERQALVRREQIAQEERDRLESKAAAVELLPVINQLKRELQSMIGDFASGFFEYYGDVPSKSLRSAVDELRTWSPKIAKAGETGELALNAIARAESALSALSDWEFYENQTDDGVIEDMERGTYETFPQPMSVVPILKSSLEVIDECIDRMNSMFS